VKTLSTALRSAVPCSRLPPDTSSELVLDQRDRPS
jgi:hypothetical protein